MISLLSLLYLLSIHTALTSAGSCISLCRDPNDCPPGPPQPGETPPIWQSCPNRPSNGAQWACQASDIDFPTVACLTADMRTCGLIGQGGRSTVFYSFGATTVEARTRFRDTLNPKGVMFNDALDEDYWNSVINIPKFNLEDSRRMPILVARYAEAMATVSTGEVFFVVRDYQGLGGGQGAYQRPLPGGDTVNVWRAYEFPTLQRNPAVTRVTSIDLTNNLAQHVDWQPNSGNVVLPASGASNLEVPPPPPGCARKRKRQAAGCVTCITFAPPGGATGTISLSGVQIPITLPMTASKPTATAPTAIAPTATAPAATAPTATTPAPAPPPPPPPPVCSAGFYGTDTSCDGKCNGPNATCDCTEVGYEVFSNACTCSCG